MVPLRLNTLYILFAVLFTFAKGFTPNAIPKKSLSFFHRNSVTGLDKRKIPKLYLSEEPKGEEIFDDEVNKSELCIFDVVS